MHLKYKLFVLHPETLRQYLVKVLRKLSHLAEADNTAPPFVWGETKTIGPK